MNRQQLRHTPFTLEDYNATELVGRVILPPPEPFSSSFQAPPVAGIQSGLPPPPKRIAAGFLEDPARVKRHHRSPIPGLVRVGLVLVQCALLVRLVCLVLHIQATTSWLVLLFAAGDLFVEPVRGLAAQLTLSWLARHYSRTWSLW